MANTYTSLQYHFTFSTKNREPWISEEIESRVWAYIGGIARARPVVVRRYRAGPTVERDGRIHEGAVDAKRRKRRAHRAQQESQRIRTTDYKRRDQQACAQGGDRPGNGADSAADEAPDARAFSGNPRPSLPKGRQQSPGMCEAPLRTLK